MNDNLHSTKGINFVAGLNWLDLEVNECVDETGIVEATSMYSREKARLTGIVEPTSTYSGEKARSVSNLGIRGVWSKGSMDNVE